MSRNTHRYAVKLPSRRSLGSIGIPDHHDALAIYFHWVRQRYYRAHAEMKPAHSSSSSSTHSAREANDVAEPFSPLFEMQFDMARFTADTLNVGAWVEGEAIMYAQDIDMVG
ncbi:hypothetical protein BKA66DRAFT_441261 [Pyrenochaeta sp. MPI-SDFR-AT-0127]|nr:hypothetical protein BKA66DRAFT_441261 [Pyrenochaeta sp. MPI-SDFR-AT-0127]